MTQIAATTSAAAATETRRAQQTRTSGASFAEAHTAAVRTASEKDKSTSSASDSKTAPKGERTEKVEGHSYREIVSGPRNGMFINNSGNERDGRAFVIVNREGREFHIYGSGKERAVYEVGRERADSGTSQGSGTGTAGTGTSATGQTGTGATGSTTATT
jgi:hypothetical protein